MLVSASARVDWAGVAGVLHKSEGRPDQGGPAAESCFVRHIFGDHISLENAKALVQIAFGPCGQFFAASLLGAGLNPAANLGQLPLESRGAVRRRVKYFEAGLHCRQGQYAARVLDAWRYGTGGVISLCHMALPLPLR